MDDGGGVCVSAPGKVLITGGYLVLDEQYSGLVLASTARFYTRICAAQIEAATDAISADEGGAIDVLIESPQFGQVIHGTLRRDESSGTYQFLVSEDSDRNAYIEETVVCAINGIDGIAPCSVTDNALALQQANSRIHVVLQADNDFYSQVERLQATNKTLHRRNLASLPKFLPPLTEGSAHSIGKQNLLPIRVYPADLAWCSAYLLEQPSGEKVVMKTGMGSSAALVTSLVGALVCFFIPANRTETSRENLELIHNLAQLSHCFVQRKIGSGFDVSAACFGSQCYTRFPASILDTFTSPEALQPEAIKRCIADRATWDISNRVKPFKLPSSFRLFMGDVSAGSATVSMVRKVLNWQQMQPEQATRVISSLSHYNSQVELGFTELHKLFAAEDGEHIETHRREMAQCGFEQWSAINTVVGSVLVSLRESFLMVRSLLREMGELAQVPIEPTEQTALIDATMAIPGVLIAGVPGAGGYDAVFVVALDESVLERIEALWVAWPQAHPISLASFTLTSKLQQLRKMATTYQQLKRKQRDDDDDGHEHGEAPQKRVHGDKQRERVTHRMAAFNSAHAVDDVRCESLTLNDHERAHIEDPDRTAAQAHSNDTNGGIEQTSSSKHRSDFSIAKLRFATESWQGMKPSNEDRHVTDAATARFPGPVFGVFDGHGGVFTVEFLVRNLLKHMSSSIKQHVGGSEPETLQRLRDASQMEMARKHEIETQMQLCQEQLQHVQQMVVETDKQGDDAAADGENEVKALRDQLQRAVCEMEAGIAQIDREEAQRKEQFRAWCQKQDAGFKRAFAEAFQRTDAQVLQKNPSRDGSTALLLWFVAGGDCKESPQLAYYTINLGDCRAVICRGGHGIPLTTDHKPSRPDEKQRIQKMGGFVGTFAGIPRVYSASGAGLSVQQSSRSSTYLAVSRAFGDRPLKLPSALVSCEPEIKRFAVEQDDLFIVIACDGIWDVLSNQDAVNIGLQHFEDPQQAADAIVKEAYRRGSSDNLTATVIQFGWHDDSTKVQQVRANARACKAQHQHPPRPLGLSPSVAAVIADSETAGETTENQDDDEEEEDEIDMFNL